jgi:hypothetical protein
VRLEENAMQATGLTEQDKERLKDAHRAFRRADELFASCPEGSEAQEVAAGVALDAQQRLLDVMIALAVGSLDEVLSPQEMAELMD